MKPSAPVTSATFFMIGVIEWPIPADALTRAPAPRRPGMLINHLGSELNPNAYLGTAVSPLGGAGGGAVVVVPSVAWKEEKPKCELVPVPEPFDR